MIGGGKWQKVVQGGARLKYIKYLINLFSCKKSEQNKSNKNKSNSTEINQNKITYNKFGYPIYMDREKKK
tara:strand:+ start:237 stop:446 length:210 start_codon:yes stop_codon:yes gene_type:complete